MATAVWTTNVPSNETTPRPRPDYLQEASQAVSAEAPISLPFNMADAVLEVLKLTALPDNWNSYGAPTISPFAIIHAARFLSQLRSDVPSPAVAPTARAGVQFAWGTDDRSVEIDVSPTGSMSVLVDDFGQVEESVIEPGVSYDPLLYRALALATEL